MDQAYSLVTGRNGVWWNITHVIVEWTKPIITRVYGWPWHNLLSVMRGLYGIIE